MYSLASDFVHRWWLWYHQIVRLCRFGILCIIARIITLKSLFSCRYLHWRQHTPGCVWNSEDWESKDPGSVKWTEAWGWDEECPCHGYHQGKGEGILTEEIVGVLLHCPRWTYHVSASRRSTAAVSLVTSLAQPLRDSKNIQVPQDVVFFIWKTILVTSWSALYYAFVCLTILWRSSSTDN